MSFGNRVFEKIKLARVVYVHAGCLFGQEAEVAGHIVGECVDRAVPVAERHVMEFIDRPPPDGEIAVLVGLGEYVGTLDVCQMLANLRFRTMEFLETRRAVVLVSGVPRMRFLGCPGSELVLDAAMCFLETLSASDAERALAEGWSCDAKDARYLAGRLLRAPVEFDCLRQTEDLAIERAETADELTGLYRRAFGELGPEIAAQIDGLTSVAGVEAIEASKIQGHLLDSMRGAGLADLSPDGRRVDILGGEGSILCQEALQEYLACTVDFPPSAAGLYSALWEIERRLRAAVRACAVGEWGSGWREKCAGTVRASTVVDRAREVAFPSVTAVGQLPNPLDWFTLGELIGTIEANLWARPKGLSVSFWTRLYGDLAPIRNRVSHARLPEPNDLEIAERWASRLRNECIGA
jgi:hypothetical protein